MNVEVLPLRRLPRTLDSFTYGLPGHSPPLQQGTWVRVPFRSAILDGILWSATSKQTDTTVRRIASTLPIPRVTKTQCALLEWMSAQYAISLSHAAFVLLPPRPCRAFPERVRRFFRAEPLPPISRSRLRVFDQQLARQRNLPKSTPVFFPCASYAERLFLAAKIAARHQTQQVLLVSPTLNALSRYASFFQKRFPDRTLVLDSRHSAGAYWQLWQSVGSQQNPVIITTRRGLGCPLHNLGAILLDDETNPLYKQFDQNPRYHVRTVVWELAKLHRVPCFAFDRVPSLAYWQKGNVVNVPPVPQKRTIVDLRRVRGAGHFALLSETVVDAYRTRPHGRMLVFHNSSGAFRTTRCTDCGWMFSCSLCGSAMVEYGSGDARCPVCTNRQVPPFACPTCGNMALKHSGKGIKSVFRTVEKLFPDKRVLLVDSDTAPEQPMSAVDILVATEKCVYHPLPLFDIIVVPAFDAQLTSPDYAAAERTFLLLERIASFGNTNSHFLIQTWNPDTALLRAFRTQTYADFFHDELDVRQKFSFPPFVRLVRLLGPAHEADRIKRMFPVTGPLPLKSRGRVAFLYRSATLRDELRTLPNTWLVDTD